MADEYPLRLMGTVPGPTHRSFPVGPTCPNTPGFGNSLRINAATELVLGISVALGVPDPSPRSPLSSPRRLVANPGCDGALFILGFGIGITGGALGARGRFGVISAVVPVFGIGALMYSGSVGNLPRLNASTQA